ncbi:hypothetical protein T484DRAFT_1882119, partial [Baffinella frigidus]
MRAGRSRERLGSQCSGTDSPLQPNIPSKFAGRSPGRGPMPEQGSVLGGLKLRGLDVPLFSSPAPSPMLLKSKGNHRVSPAPGQRDRAGATSRSRASGVTGVTSPSRAGTTSPARAGAKAKTAKAKEAKICARCNGICEGNLRFACGRRVALCINCTSKFAKLLQARLEDASRFSADASHAVLRSMSPERVHVVESSSAEQYGDSSVRLIHREHGTPDHSPTRLERRPSDTLISLSARRHAPHPIVTGGGEGDGLSQFSPGSLWTPGAVGSKSDSPRARKNGSLGPLQVYLARRRSQVGAQLSPTHRTATHAFAVAGLEIPSLAKALGGVSPRRPHDGSDALDEWSNSIPDRLIPATRYKRKAKRREEEEDKDSGDDEGGERESNQTTSNQISPNQDKSNQPYFGAKDWLSPGAHNLSPGVHNLSPVEPGGSARTPRQARSLFADPLPALPSSLVQAQAQDLLHQLPDAPLLSSRGVRGLCGLTPRDRPRNAQQFQQPLQLPLSPHGKDFQHSQPPESLGEIDGTARQLVSVPAPGQAEFDWKTGAWANGAAVSA